MSINGELTGFGPYSTVGADASQFSTHHINNLIAWPELQALGERLGRRDDTDA